MATAVIEFDSLSDAIGAAAQNDDFLLVAGRTLALRYAADRFFVSRIHIGGERRELCCARIDAFEHRPNTKPRPQFENLTLSLSRQLRKARIGETQRLQTSHTLCVSWQPLAFNALFYGNDFRDLAQKPGIVFRDRSDLVHRKANAHRLRHDAQPV